MGAGAEKGDGKGHPRLKNRDMNKQGLTQDSRVTAQQRN